MRIPSHPGELLKVELEERKMSPHRLALELGVPANRISAIVKCQRAVTPDTALRLARYFGGGAEFWITMQSRHDLGVVEKAMGPEIRRTVRKSEMA